MLKHWFAGYSQTLVTTAGVSFVAVIELSFTVVTLV